MILVSELAKTALLEALQQSGVGQSQALRLTTVQGKVVLEVDSPNENDHVIHHGSSPVLIVDRHTEVNVGDGMIDIHDGENGAELVFRRISGNQQQS